MKRILFLGDSITDAERFYSDDGLGFGYVKILSAHLPFEIANRGFNGFTIRDVKRTVEKELKKPWDYISLLAGVNDIPSLMAGGESLEAFEKDFDYVLNAIKEYGVVVVQPFLFTVPEELISWQPTLCEICGIIKALCEKYSLPLLPMWDIFKREAEKTGEEALTVDGVHLTDAGHRTLADNWLKLFNAVIR